MRLPFKDPMPSGILRTSGFEAELVAAGYHHRNCSLSLLYNTRSPHVIMMTTTADCSYTHPQEPITVAVSRVALELYLNSGAGRYFWAHDGFQYRISTDFDRRRGTKVERVEPISREDKVVILGISDGVLKRFVRRIGRHVPLDAITHEVYHGTTQDRRNERP